MSSRFSYPFPPESEQLRIERCLDDADSLIAALERLIAKKQAIKQGMMQQLLTGTDSSAWLRRSLERVVDWDHLALLTEGCSARLRMISV